MVFLKEFFEKVDFEKKSADDKKNMKNFPGGKELKLTITAAADNKFCDAFLHLEHL